MADIESYKVDISESQLVELKQRLSLTRFPRELEDAKWDLGSPLADIKRLATYWANGFDWRKTEAKINELPQFRTTIQVPGFEPLRIHFVHQKSGVKEAIPLLFVHGWPGSFLEVRKLLPLLCEGDGKEAPAFHVVAPSIPNFGFSDGLKKRGFGLKQYAETCHVLMQKLGYIEYVTQGGDLGFRITRAIGLLYPEHCKANHINFIHTSPPSFLQNPILALQNLFTPYSDRDKKGFARAKWFADEGRGYAALQTTKPQTLGYLLADSPVGLLAWIYEKLHDWTDDYAWTDDEILEWVSIYQFSTAGPEASLQIYYEAQHTPASGGGITRMISESYIPKVKQGMAYFPRDICYSPKTWAACMGDVVLQSVHAHGGHFATHEHPELIVKDLVSMFGKGGGAYGVVTGQNGYV